MIFDFIACILTVSNRAADKSPCYIFSLLLPAVSRVHWRRKPNDFCLARTVSNFKNPKINFSAGVVRFNLYFGLLFLSEVLPSAHIRVHNYGV